MQGGLQGIAVVPFPHAGVHRRVSSAVGQQQLAVAVDEPVVEPDPVEDGDSDPDHVVSHADSDALLERAALEPHADSDPDSHTARALRPGPPGAPSTGAAVEARPGAPSSPSSRAG